MSDAWDKAVVHVGATELEEDDKGFVVVDAGDVGGEGTSHEFKVSDRADDPAEAEGGACALGHEGAAGVLKFFIRISHGAIPARRRGCMGTLRGDYFWVRYSGLLSMR